MGPLSPVTLLPVVRTTEWIIELRLLDNITAECEPLDNALARIRTDGARETANPPILLLGPSGCGKTWTIMQIAKTYQFIILF